MHRSEAATWESPKGKGDLWDEGEMEIGDTVIIGTWITKPVLDDYNKQAAPDLKIPTLTELAKMIVTIWGLPETESFDPKAKKMGKEKPPVRRFGAKTSRAVFVPDDEASPAAADSGRTVLRGLDERGQAPSSKGMGNDPKSNTSKEENHVTHEGNRLPNGVTSVPPEASQDSGNVTHETGEAGLETTRGEAIAMVLDVVRELCKDGWGAHYDAIVSLARQSRLSQDYVDLGLKRLKSKGELYEPARGTYRLTEGLP